MPRSSIIRSSVVTKGISPGAGGSPARWASQASAYRSATSACGSSSRAARTAVRPSTPRSSRARSAWKPTVDSAPAERIRATRRAANVTPPGPFWRMASTKRDSSPKRAWSSSASAFSSMPASRSERAPLTKRSTMPVAASPLDLQREGRQLHLAGGGDQDVRGHDVAKHQPQRAPLPVFEAVRKRQAAQHLTDDPDDQLERERGALPTQISRRTLKVGPHHVLDHQEAAAVVLAHVQDRHQVGVREALADVRLIDQTPPLRRVVRPAARHVLDDRAVEGAKAGGPLAEIEIKSILSAQRPEHLKVADGPRRVGGSGVSALGKGLSLRHSIVATSSLSGMASMPSRVIGDHEEKRGIGARRSVIPRSIRGRATSFLAVDSLMIPPKTLASS